MLLSIMSQLPIDFHGNQLHGSSCSRHIEQLRDSGKARNSFNAAVKHKADKPVCTHDYTWSPVSALILTNKGHLKAAQKFFDIFIEDITGLFSSLN